MALASIQMSVFDVSLYSNCPKFNVSRVINVAYVATALHLSVGNVGWRVK